jgi:hypothetical protein
MADLAFVPFALFALTGVAAWAMAWRNYRLAASNYREADKLLAEIKRWKVARDDG